AMRIAFDHGGFQRRAAAVVAFGGAGALASAVAGADAAMAAAVTVGAAALPLGAGVVRAGREQRGASLLAAVVALAGAGLVWWRLGGGPVAGGGGVGAGGRGLLAGLGARGGAVGGCLPRARAG